MYKSIVKFVMLRLKYIKKTKKSYKTLPYGNMSFPQNQTVLVYSLNIQQNNNPLKLKYKCVTIGKFRTYIIQ